LFNGERGDENLEIGQRKIWNLELKIEDDRWLISRFS